EGEADFQSQVDVRGGEDRSDERAEDQPTYRQFFRSHVSGFEGRMNFHRSRRLWKVLFPLRAAGRGMQAPHSTPGMRCDSGSRRGWPVRARRLELGLRFLVRSATPHDLSPPSADDLEALVHPTTAR